MLKKNPCWYFWKNWTKYSYLFLTRVLFHSFRLTHLVSKTPSPLLPYPHQIRRSIQCCHAVWFLLSHTFLDMRLTKSSLHIIHPHESHRKKDKIPFQTNTYENVHSILMNVATDSHLRWVSGHNYVHSRLKSRI